MFFGSCLFKKLYICIMDDNKTMQEFNETGAMLCECSSFEHQVWFYSYKDENYDELCFSVHLHSNRSFIGRLWYAIKYIFGYKSRYGAWDEFLMKPEDRKTLLRFLESNVQGK